MRAVSVSRAVLPHFSRPAVSGVDLGQGYIDFGGFVLAVTRPGAPRMPNGVEASVSASRGRRAWLGDGVLRLDGEILEPGPAWDPVPVVRCVPKDGPHLRPIPEALAGRGDGLTPAGDDILAGYAAGLALFHGRLDEAGAIARTAGPMTTRLSATLLDHASRGELPEPAHVFLELGDPGPLDRFGHSSGRCLRLGLVLAAWGADGRQAGEELLGLA
ncbi:MAG TPA: DUF2877 domain-containing protein [Candidatus Dormibacteraeota bacterium]